MRLNFKTKRILSRELAKINEHREECLFWHWIYSSQWQKNNQRYVYLMNMYGMEWSFGYKITSYNNNYLLVCGMNEGKSGGMFILIRSTKSIFYAVITK